LGVVGFGFKTFAGAKFRTGWEVRGSHVPDLATTMRLDSHVVVIYEKSTFNRFFSKFVSESSTENPDEPFHLETTNLSTEIFGRARSSL
jgi:hypothetical protein